MENIKDIKSYTDGMKKSLLDKMFFMDKIDSTEFIDYGCADGTLLGFMKDMFPKYNYTGYDVSEEMISLANKKHSDINFVNEFNYTKTSEKSTLILSSIIHEVYSYCSKSEIENFWDNVYNSNFDYIVIRDMMIGNSCEKMSDINDVASILRSNNHGRLKQFEGIWGTIENNKNLVHYLLKYRYIPNWDREVKENYLPIFREELLSNIPSDYEVIFHEHYVLPFLKEKVRDDFGIELKDNTHIKLILKRKVS